MKHLESEIKGVDGKIESKISEQKETISKEIMEELNTELVLRTKSVTEKEMNKYMAEIYDPGGIQTRAARLISQYHNH